MTSDPESRQLAVAFGVVMGLLYLLVVKLEGFYIKRKAKQQKNQKCTLGLSHAKKSKKPLNFNSNPPGAKKP